VVVTALTGAMGFLTRLPVGRDERAWDAFRSTPAAFPLAGWLVGLLLAGPFAAGLLASLPAPTVAAAFVAWVYVLTGITHVDGLADLGDTMVVHGDTERRREVLTDTTTGVGAIVTVVVAVAGLGLAGVALAGRPWRALSVVVAAEVGAKAGMAALVALSTSTHEGLASAFTRATGLRSLVRVALVAAPAGALGWPSPAPLVALAGAVGTALCVRAWAVRGLGGVNGDVFGAANELGRLVGLHAGVVAWTLS